MTTWKTVAVLATGAALLALAPTPAAAYLPPHGMGGGAAVAPKGKKVEIAFTGAIMTINGKKFALPADEADLIAALGKPDRTADLQNKIITWDDHGLFAYIRPKSTVCHAFAVCLGRDKLDFWPKKNFIGKLTVDGAELRADSKISEVNDAKKGGKPFEADDVLTNVWSVDYKEGTLYLRRSEVAKEGFIKLELGIPSK